MCIYIRFVGAVTPIDASSASGRRGSDRYLLPLAGYGVSLQRASVDSLASDFFNVPTVLVVFFP